MKIREFFLFKPLENVFTKQTFFNYFWYKVNVAGREGGGVGDVGADFIGGGLQAPADSLCWTAEVTPSGVGIHATIFP